MLTDRERLVRHCVIMRFKEPEALAYLKANGHDISAPTYWRIRQHLKKIKLQRLYEIGKTGFEDQHLERIDQLELIQQELWKCYHMEKTPFRKAQILRHLAEIQPYLSTYYETTRMVIEKQHGRLGDQQEANSVPGDTGSDSGSGTGEN